MRKQHILQTSVLIILVFLLMVSVSQTFGYWASSVNSGSNSTQATIAVGSWEQLTQTEISVQDLQAFYDYLSSINDPYIEAIYNESLVVDGATITMEDINLEGFDWNIVGTGQLPVNGKAPRIGFVQIVDRSLDNLNQPIHPILPPVPTDPLPYPEFSYFMVNDVLNTQTNNLSSIRLNYNVQITTSNPINDVTSISFYAHRGLYSMYDLNPDGRDDDYDLATNRMFYVSVSTDGVNFTVIGSATPGFTTNQSASFNFYNYPIPSQFQNTPIYIRIFFDGGTVKVGGSWNYSRLIIDELSINN